KRESSIPVQQLSLLSLKEKISEKFLASWRAFFQEKPWKLIFLFILFYKVGDSVLNQMTMPFLLELGFSTFEIANIAKTFGIFAMIIGGAVAGILLVRINVLFLLSICSLLMTLSCLMFMIQAYLGH